MALIKRATETAGRRGQRKTGRGRLILPVPQSISRNAGRSVPKWANAMGRPFRFWRIGVARSARTARAALRRVPALVAVRLSPIKLVGVEPQLE